MIDEGDHSKGACGVARAVNDRDFAVSAKDFGEALLHMRTAGIPWPREEVVRTLK